MDSPEALRKRIQTLAPIVAGLQQALAKLDLDDTERAVLKSVYFCTQKELVGERH